MMNGGELFDEIVSRDEGISEREASVWFKQLLHGVQACHNIDVVHRDLKPENILMNRDEQDPKITIIDFGTSGIFDSNKKME